MRKRFILLMLIPIIMKNIELTDKEKLILYGLIKYPHLTDKSLSEKIPTLSEVGCGCLFPQRTTPITVPCESISGAMRQDLTGDFVFSQLLPK